MESKTPKVNWILNLKKEHGDISKRKRFHYLFKYQLQSSVVRLQNDKREICERKDSVAFD